MYVHSKYFTLYVDMLSCTTLHTEGTSCLKMSVFPSNQRVHPVLPPGLVSKSFSWILGTVPFLPYVYGQRVWISSVQYLCFRGYCSLGSLCRLDGLLDRDLLLSTWSSVRENHANGRIYSWWPERLKSPNGRNITKRAIIDVNSIVSWWNYDILTSIIDAIHMNFEQDNKMATATFQHFISFSKYTGGILGQTRGATSFWLEFCQQCCHGDDILETLSVHHLFSSVKTYLWEKWDTQFA